MPNHVLNGLRVTGKVKDIKEFLDDVADNSSKDKSEHREFSFEKIIPMPSNIFRGDVGAEAKKKYGKNNWYDWSYENWGTKWNAYDVTVTTDFPSPTIQYLDQDKGAACILFNSAWSPPAPILNKIVGTYTTLTFEIAFIEEGNESWGKSLYKKGVEVKNSDNKDTVKKFFKKYF